MSYESRTEGFKGRAAEHRDWMGKFIVEFCTPDVGDYEFSMLQLLWIYEQGLLHGYGHGVEDEMRRCEIANTGAKKAK